LKKISQGTGYKHLISLRVWDGDIGDEGVRAFYQFMIETGNTSLQLVEFLNCGIGVLGCEFISRIFDKERVCKINILTLDYNSFGNEGLAQLMENLKDCKTLNYLSLAYCGIDENGVKFFSDYLALQDITLEKLVLQGNPIKNAGMAQLINIIYDNTSLEEINLNNILFGNNTEVMQNLVSLMKQNTTLCAYSLKFNFITDQGR
jgi:Ran GTPase-activating protein (RanGAP) involved in mRNA processing and transport